MTHMFLNITRFPLVCQVRKSYCIGPGKRDNQLNLAKRGEVIDTEIAIKDNTTIKEADWFS